MKVEVSFVNTGAEIVPDLLPSGTFLFARDGKDEEFVVLKIHKALFIRLGPDRADWNDRWPAFWIPLRIMESGDSFNITV